MENIEKGDFIVSQDGLVREQVEARLEDLLFTRAVYPDGGKSPVMGPTHIDDILARGFRLEDQGEEIENAA